MALTVATSDLLKTLDPAAAATRAAYGKRRRPFVAGYKARYRAEGASIVYGVNDPGSLSTKCETLNGAGAADNASTFTYAVATLSMPTTTDLTDAADYLNAIMVAYRAGDEANAILVTRLAKDAAASTDNTPYWSVKDGNEIYTHYGYADGKHVDWPVGWILRLIVPVSADIGTALISTTAVGEGVVTVRDFMAAGDRDQASAVILNRVMQ